MQPNQPQIIPQQNSQPAPQPQAVMSQPTPAPAQPQQQSTASQQKENPTSTQATLIISELRDSMVIMKDGSFRAVVACKSINFDLMSDTEREAVEPHEAPREIQKGSS